MNGFVNKLLTYWYRYFFHRGLIGTGVSESCGMY